MKRCLLLVLVPAVCATFAETIDSTINRTHTPTISLQSLLPLVRDQFSVDTNNYICVSAISRSESFGGGWSLLFESSVNSRQIHVSDQLLLLSDRTNACLNLSINPNPLLEDFLDSTNSERLVIAAWNTTMCCWNTTFVQDD